MGVNVVKTPEQGRQEVLEWVADATQVPVDELDLEKQLVEIGLDSLEVVHLIATIEAIMGQELQEDMILQASCLRDILDLMDRRVLAA
ncbi:MAG: acyl carrier protein [Phycisphaerales bacterium]|nr:MAG: acyl carrier protein [Phycisphaerales bacterium]